jgi:hypothetical protein
MHSRVRSSVDRPKIVSNNKMELIMILESYINIQAPLSRLETLHHKSISTFLNPTNDVWPHDISIRILASNIPLLLAMLVFKSVNHLIRILRQEPYIASP